MAIEAHYQVTRINMGLLLGQCVYHIYTYLKRRVVVGKATSLV